MSDVLALQNLPVTDEVAALKRSRRKSHHGGGTKTVCLISLNDTLNGLELGVLNIFGGAF
jgi:hypothetical protein